MPLNEKGRPEGRPIPNADATESIISLPERQVSREFARDIMRAEFGRNYRNWNYVVVHEPFISRFKARPPSRIRAWRAA
jgi:hypothetical protein